MRLRFSLRTLFIITALFAAMCTWAVLPSLTARRFLHAVAKFDYRAADEFIRNPHDRFFVDWADKRWAFRARAELQPMTIGDLFRGRRQIAVRLGYFEFDQNAGCTAQIAATPFGMGSPTLTPVTYSGMFIDKARDAAVPQNDPPRR